MAGTTQPVQHVSTASLSFMLELGAPDAAGLVPVPTEAHLLPPGPFRAVDGRPFDCEAWQLDAAIAQRIMQRLAALANDVVIDYEHQTLYKEQNGQPAPAAGWFKKLEWREPAAAQGAKPGLYAVGIEWTPDGKESVASKEYRYVSAVFTYYPSTGEVLEIICVALTNTPGLDGLDALSARAALSRSAFSPPKPNERETMDKDQHIAALSAELAALKPQVAAIAALTAQRDKAVADLAAVAAVAEKEKHTALLTAALSSGRLAPAQKPWAEKQSLAALSEYLDATAPLVDTTRQTPKGGADAAAGLTEVELATCTRMGVTPEEFLDAKK